MPLVAPIPTDFSDLCPRLHDALHDTQRHIQINGDLSAVFVQNISLVNDLPLQIPTVMLSDPFQEWFTHLEIPQIASY
jgi:hypothetical protein